MISKFWIPPAFILLLGSLAVPFLKGKARNAYLLILPLVALADTIIMAFSSPGLFYTINFLSYKLVFARIDKLSLVFGYIFCIAAFIGTLYSIHLKGKSENIAAFLYAGSALGVVFAGDFFSLFIFWEIMALGSAYLIWARKTKQSQVAGFRYLAIHLFGGLLLLSGILIQVSKTGSIAFNLMNLGKGGLAAWLILLGFALNCAIPPLSAWLSDAYPEATITGSVFLSAFTTKTAVYVLIRGFRGTELLIWAGAIMAFYGVVYAVLANDIRRILAYHIISQVGFMVAGVGIGTELAINGAVAHAFAHILYKGLLFMGAGAVVLVTGGKSKLSELGGIYKKMPWAFSLYMIGALSISAFPLFSGFVSKSMVISAAEEQKLVWIWLLLTISSAGTWLHTGLKLPWFTWLGKDRDDIQAAEPPRNMLYAMGAAAVLCVLIGIFPHIFYRLLPYTSEYLPYTYTHVVWTMQYLLLTAIAFFALLKYLVAKPYIVLDTDWFYRRTRPAFAYLSQLAFYANNWFESTTEKIPAFLGRAKEPLLLATNYLSDLLLSFWVDFWLFHPIAQLHSAEEFEEEKGMAPILHKIIFLPFGWLIRFLDHLGNKLANLASDFDANLDGAGREIFANLFFNAQEFSSRANRISSFSNQLDKVVIDGFINGVAATVFYIGERARRVQTGLVQNYALIFIFIISIIIILLSLRGGF